MIALWIVVMLIVIALIAIVWDYRELTQKCESLDEQVKSLTQRLEKDYWTKEVIARTYGEAPVVKKEAAAKQDEIVKQNSPEGIQS